MGNDDTRARTTQTGAQVVLSALFAARYSPSPSSLASISIPSDV